MDSRQDEFTALVDRHARVIASAIRRVCSRRHRALIPDIEQDVRAALWKRLQDGKPIEHPVSYLYKVAMTAALAAVRRSPIAAELSPEAWGDGPASEPFLGLLPAEQSRLLAEGLDALPIEEARAVRAHLAGFNHEDVASLYGWTEAIARHRIYRGLDKLRAKLRGGARP
ncbi:MAG TPA: sigma-70 family RNA polymerase sigma factor [Thermoanaerobaculia bacterium]|nr:sigma-70 family RNA polymerase sigma factor [Thermoanaerobaculia bacterium]